MMLVNDMCGLFHAGAPRRLSLYQIAQIINRVGGYDPDLLIGTPRLDAGPIPPRAGNVSMDCTKLISALGHNPLGPWPWTERLVPDHWDWHHDRPADQSHSPEYLHRVLCCNPALRKKKDGKLKIADSTL